MSYYQDSVVPGCASLICFNLGYLPSSEQPKHATVTKLDTTIAALHAALQAVQSGGLISVVAYTGHPGIVL